MQKYTVCLYDGTVLAIDNIVATKVVEAEGMDTFDHIAIFYDKINKSEYQNRITKKSFPVYYERTICISDTIHTYDFGSYIRFIAVFEGELEESKLKEIIKNATWNKNERKL